MKIELKKEGLEGDNLKFIAGLETSLNEALSDIKTGPTEDEVKSLINGYDYESVEGFRELKSALEAQGIKLKELEEKGAVYKTKSIGDILYEKRDELKAVKEKKDRLSFEIEFKAPGTMLTTTNITPQPNPYLPAPTILPGINRVIEPERVITDYISQGTISTPRVVWVNEVNGEGDAEWVGEGQLKPLVDFDWQTEDEAAKKIAAVVKVSEEMLDDIPWMQDEIERLLRDKVRKGIDNGVLNGDGSGVNLDGIFNRVGGYVQTCLNGSISNPGLAEVLLAAATQIRNIGFTGRLIAFVNPCDWAKAKMRKDENGNIIDLRGVLDGITVVETSEMTAGSFFIGDMRLFVLDVYKALRVEIGWENDDFRRNLRTIIAESRLLLRISSNNIGAFVHDTIANVQTLIAAPATQAA